MAISDLTKIFPKLKTKVSLAPFTTFAIGGEANFFLEVTTKGELVEAVRVVRKNNVPNFIFAGGSNLVFPDKVPDLLFIRYIVAPDVTSLQVENPAVYAEAGVPLSALVMASIKAGLSGLEALSGIPGTVGGAIFGNAGAYGQGISDKLEEIEIFDGQDVKWIPAAAAKFTYRSSIFKEKDWLVLAGRFRLEKGETSKLLEKSREIIKIREQKYPPGLKCPGSYFKNLIAADLSPETLKLIPPDRIISGKVPAGYLLEVVGARGMKKGEIMVPDYHGNLLINSGGGRAADVRALAEILKNKVKDHFGIQLEEEVRVIS